MITKELLEQKLEVCCVIVRLVYTSTQLPREYVLDWAPNNMSKKPKLFRVILCSLSKGRSSRVYRVSINITTFEREKIEEKLVCIFTKKLP